MLGIGLALALPLLGLAGTFQGCSELELPGVDSGVAVSLIVKPTSASFALTEDKVQTKRFYACAQFTDANTRDARVNDAGKVVPTICPSGYHDVSNQVEWKVEPSTMGSFKGNLFRTEVKVNDKLSPATHGGVGAVSATYGEFTATATITVSYKKTFYDQGTSSATPKKFGGSKAGTVVIYYPPKNVLVPPNLGQMEVQYAGPAGTNLYRLTFKSTRSTVVIYTTKTLYNLGIDQWRAVGTSSAGLNVSLVVEATKNIGGVSTRAVSATYILRMAESPVKGGLYYWVVEQAAPGTQAQYGSIYRYDFNDPKLKADAYYTQKEAKDCVGCHVLSRGGEYLAFTYTGGYGDAAIFDVQSKTALYDSRKGYKADLQTFNKDGSELIVVSRGVLTRRSSSDGKLLETLPTLKGKMATHPDWSPDDKMLVYVQVEQKDYYVKYKDDVHFNNGSVYIMTRAGGKWSTPKLLVKCGNGKNCYYPTFAPGSDWIAYNTSTGDSYSDADANIWIIKTNGTGNRQLTGVNGLNISNSWPRWSPFVQNYRNTTLYWLTFSSVRDYGRRLLNSKITKFSDKSPQVWMTSFDLNAAASGKDPSSPPFWLPFQDITHHNHIAQWTSKVVKLQ